jgi:hypothetical protein
MNIDGTYFCGPREYNLTVKKYEQLKYEYSLNVFGFEMSFSESSFKGNEVVLLEEKAPSGKVKL